MSLNRIAVDNNGCKMPVLVSEQYFEFTSPSNRHFFYTDVTSVSYPLLTDIITIRNSVYSVGDIIMLVSLVSLILLDFYVAYIIFKFRLFGKDYK